MRLRKRQRQRQRRRLLLLLPKKYERIQQIKELKFEMKNESIQREEKFPNLFSYFKTFPFSNVLSLSFSVSFSLSFSVSFSLILCFSLSPSVSLSLILCFFLSHSLFLSVSLSFSVSFSLSLILCLFHSFFRCSFLRIILFLRSHEMKSRKIFLSNQSLLFESSSSTHLSVGVRISGFLIEPFCDITSVIW